MFVDYAKELIDEGFNPIPLKENKTPQMLSGEKSHNWFKEKIDKVEKRFSSCDKIGIACGQISDGLILIDFDAHGGEDIKPIFDSFCETEIVKFILSEGRAALFQTMNGGYHCLMKCDHYYKSKKLAAWVNNQTGQVTTMIEVKGNGGYVCVYPSKGYTHIGGVEIIKLATSDKEEMEQLFEICQSFNQNVSIQNVEKQPETGEKKDWPERWSELTPEGKFNNEKADYVKELLAENGWTYIENRKHDNVELWLRPGKEKGISATFGQRFNMFYVFSQSAHPFQANSAYSPFQVYTILKFNGDWKKAKDSIKPVNQIVDIEEVETPEILQRFPIEVFPDELKNYILELNKTLNYHIDFLSVAVLFTIATINGNKFKLKVKNGWNAPSIFWFACVGYPGTIKSHPLKTIIKPLERIDYESKLVYDKEFAEYDAIRESNKGNTNGIKKPFFKKTIMSDFTLEALHRVHEKNQRGLGLYKDELRGFFSAMDKYRGGKGGDEQFWLESFNNGSLSVDRVNSNPLYIDNICINIIGTIQHDVLHKLMQKVEENGLLDRFLYTTAETTVYPLNDFEIDERYNLWWNEVVKTLNKFFDYNPNLPDKDSVILQMTLEAWQYYKEYDKEIVSRQMDDSETQNMKNYYSKIKTYFPRFALIISIIDGEFSGGEYEVGLNQLKKAKLISEYFISTAKNIFKNASENLDIDEVGKGLRGKKQAEKIVALHERGFKNTQIAKYLNVTKQYVGNVITKNKPKK